MASKFTNQRLPGSTPDSWPRTSPRRADDVTRRALPTLSKCLLWVVLCSAVGGVGVQGTGAEESPTGVGELPALPIAIAQEGSVWRVTAGGEPFTELDAATYRKPICYPIFGPGQVPMTRNHPMRPGTPGEATDHPHHKSMWFAHGAINGVSFWDEKGQVRFAELRQLTPNSITFTNDWLSPTGELVCRDETTIRFGATPTERTIDWDVVYHPVDGRPLVFGDTKEGTMAIRTHPHLNLTNPPGPQGETIVGQAVNSEGVSGKEIWGLRARWVHYSGKVAGEPVGISIFDHPENLRHPTYWHARDYGLIAANPFGQHDFAGSGDGTYTLPAAETLRFRYRFVFHAETPDTAKIEGLYGEFR